MKKILFIAIVLLGLYSCSNKPNESNNTFTDNRDGKIYKTIKIGNQIWMAENLNYEAPKSFHYLLSNYSDNGREYIKEILKKPPESWTYYGYDVALSACPEGWHIPSMDEWIILKDNLKKSNMNDSTLLNGGSSGLNFLLLYYYNPFYKNDKKSITSTISIGNKFGELGMYWSSTDRGGQNGGKKIFTIFKTGENDFESIQENDKNEVGLSVRCVKD